jgi:hypothetical protein
MSRGMVIGPGDAGICLHSGACIATAVLLTSAFVAASNGVLAQTLCLLVWSSLLSFCPTSRADARWLAPKRALYVQSVLHTGW